jgi:serine phosphatase RsbU (regulator of sigma subunit)
MKKKLLIQVGIAASLFLAAVLIAVEAVLYTSAEKVYLTAKNEMIGRDLNVMYSDICETESAASLIEYWQNNPDKIRGGFTQEENDSLEKLWASDFDSAEWNNIENGFDQLAETEPAYQHMLADDFYLYLVNSLHYRLIQFGYERVYLADISDKSDGTVFIAASAEETGEDRIERTRFGSNPIFDIRGTNAAGKLRGGAAGDIAYDVVNFTNGTPLYAGYILVAAKDGHCYALCLLYDWSEFSYRLNNSVLPSVLVSALLIVVANVLLISFLYVRSIRPVTQIQKNVREYTDTKNSERIISELSRITAKNEFGELAADVSRLADEIEHYTSEIARFASEKERTAAELDLASRIQLSALPSEFPAFPDRSEFDLFASMSPAKEVGGDFYDFFMIDSDHLALVIADVSGKGVPAALFMMASKILLNDKAILGGSPAEILGFVNERICSGNNDSMFVTVWLGILEISTGKLTCSNAGHEYPVLKKAGRDYELFRDAHSPAVGVVSGIRYKDYEISLEPGDTLFVYTDGVPEATDAGNELFGTDRLLDALNSAGDVFPRELLHAVRSAVDDFVGEAPQFDDMTMLALRYFG